MGKRTVIVVDDSPDQLALLTAQLERSGLFVTESFGDAASALARVQDDPPDGVVCDLKMPGFDGLQLTRRLKGAYPSMPVIIATAAGSEEDAFACLAAGATDFVTKPIDPPTLIARIRRALDDAPARELLAQTTKARFDPHGIVGTHPRVQELRRFVDRVAAVRQASVLLLGESGTGKNLVARAIHAASDASRFRFVEVNCAAFPAHLLEAELFGYEKGAFTDARQAKKGLVEEADEGTLFLDEIGSMPLDLQAKLLTFLESRAFRRIGATTERSVELRIVAATNSKLPELVRQGMFREDLLYRLDVASHTLPPLREIRSDIGALAGHFAKRAAEYFRRPELHITAEAVEVLHHHDWPGNARELRNVVERAMIFSTGPTLNVRVDMVAAAGSPGRMSPTMGVAGSTPESSGASGAAVQIPLGLALCEVERIYIQQTLEQTDGNVNEAASRLGMTRKVFWTKRKKLGLI